MLQSEHSAILSTFIKLQVVIKTFVFSISEWLFYTGFTVDINSFENSEDQGQLVSEDSQFSMHPVVPL